MSWIMTKRGSQDNIITYEHYCDTFSDLSNIPSSQVTLGSTAVVINDEDNGLGIYMANSQKEWVPISTSIGGGSGEITLDLIHICSSEEYNSSTKVPTIEDAEVNKIYLVPNNSNGNNLFDEWIYADDAWEKIGGGNINIPISDVQVNGTSIVSNGVANMPIASVSDLGVVKIDTNSAIGCDIPNGGTLKLLAPSNGAIKAGTSSERTATIAQQHRATFYGLAKAAGDATQSQSSNAVGTYTDEAKTAIKSMLGVNVDDVQINGTSVVSNGVANVPVASTTNYGVLKVGTSATGLGLDSSGYLKISASYESEVKAGTDYYRPIVPNNQHFATFYGLAKAAGDTTQKDSSNAVGAYTDSAKAAIQHMLGTDTILADYEADTTADQAYAIGELFMLNGKLHQATAVIATGDTFTVGTNCAIVNAADVFPHDVKVNGASVVTSGVANIQKATDSHFGVVKTNQTYGIWSNNGVIQLVKPGISSIKAGTDQYMPIYVDSQHSSTFYGLAKAAGADMASSSNAVGTYTDTAKAAICSMIGAVSSNQGAANAGKVLGIGNDGSVSPVSAGSSSTLYGLQDTNFVQQNLIPGDALTYSYAADGTMTWSNVPLMYSCSLAESDFGGLSTYTYLLITNRHHQDGSDLEFYIEQGSRVVVYDPDTGGPALFSIGFVILNNGEMDERGNMLYEVWFIDMTQGHSPLVVRRFRKTYIEDAQDYYYIEII